MLACLGDSLASSQAPQLDILHPSGALRDSGYLWALQWPVQRNTTWRKMVLEEYAPSCLDHTLEFHLYYYYT